MEVQVHVATIISLSSKIICCSLHTVIHFEYSSIHTEYEIYEPLVLLLNPVLMMS